MKKKIISVLFVVLICVLLIIGVKRNHQSMKQQEKEYGVFLSITDEDHQWQKKLQGYQTIVIDAQNFSKKEVQWIKAHNEQVLSYINLGAIENFRPYYKKYQKLTFAPYENWEEERWVNVNHQSWQSFIETKLVPLLLQKGIDGFFVDNLDVFDQLKGTLETYNSLKKMLEVLRENQRPVLINGADTFVSECMNKEGNKVNHFFSGINQETVLTAIDFDKQQLKAQTKKEFSFYNHYLKTVKQHHLQVYLLEYTTDKKLAERIKAYCQKNNYHYYLSDSIELDG